MRKFLFLFFIVLALFFVLFIESEDSSESERSQQEDRTQEHVLPQQALLSVTLGFPDATYEIIVPQGSTVYDLLDKASLQYGFSFSGKGFPGMGFFIEEINGLRQNPRTGKYWIYYINSRKAEVGISTYQLKAHDVILWKYEDEE